MKILRLLPLLALLLLLPAAQVSAQGNYGLVNDTVHDVGSPLPAITSAANAACDAQGGACGFVILAQYVVNKFRPILTIVAVLIITILGVHMLIGQEDDRLEKTRVAMTSILSGLVLLYIIDPFIAAFYGTKGEVLQSEASISNSVNNIISPELGGLINWVLTIVASLAILIIIINALKAVLNGGSEDGTASIRKTLISVAAGLALLVFRITIADNFVDHPTSPVPVLGVLVNVINILLGFLALAALAVVLYAGISMLLSFGKDEQWQQAKGILARSLIGFVVIMLSLTLVHFVIAPGVGA